MSTRSRPHLRPLAATAAALVTLATTAVVGAGPAAAVGYPFSQTFTGPATSWVVPSGVTSVHIHVQGGSGADGSTSGAGGAGGHGGLGGTVDANVAVTPGQRLDIVPGNAGSSDRPGAGWSSGGRAGTDASDIHNPVGEGNGGGTTVVSRAGAVLVAAGGGGGGGSGSMNQPGHDGGDGGNGGANRGYAGHGFPNGSGGSGSSGSQFGGEGGNAPLGSYSGGGGGGGGGYNPAGTGGGAGGHSAFDALLAGASGGGGAGGASWASDPAATYGVASGPGDGSVTISGSTGAVHTSGSVTASASVVPVGTTVTFTVNLSFDSDWIPSVRPPTGTITIGTYDPVSGNSTAQAWSDALFLPGGITWSVLPHAAQTIYVWASYSGDDVYTPWQTTRYTAVGVYQPITLVAFEPQSIDFGSQSVGSTTNRTVTVNNDGGLPWTIASLGLNDPSFAITGGTCGSNAVPVNSSCTFQIGYTPTTAGTHNGALTVTDTAGGTNTVTLTGSTPVVDPGGPPPAPGAPRITRISPSGGSRRGGTTVTITGTNLVNVTAVRFGSNPATNVSCNAAATSCTVTAPAGRGTVHVTVTTPVGTTATSGRDRYEYR